MISYSASQVGGPDRRSLNVPDGQSLLEMSDVSKKRPEKTGAETVSLDGGETASASAAVPSHFASQPSEVEPVNVAAEQTLMPELVHAEPNATPPAAPETEAGQGQDLFGKRRVALVAAVVLATLSGALGGAVATTGFSYLRVGDAAGARSDALEQAVARINADIANLKISLEQASGSSVNQFNKTSERLDKLEQALAEPAAKLAKLSEAVERLPAATPPTSAATAVARESTGSIADPVPAPAAVPQPEVRRLPTVEGWVLRHVGNGVALIQGRQGLYEVYAGVPVPGLGRVDAIRRQDGRWVVVTSKGLIVAR
jgi:hypothetical protein